VVRNPEGLSSFFRRLYMIYRLYINYRLYTNDRFTEPGSGQT
jgi:hypothetical protein